MQEYTEYAEGLVTLLYAFKNAGFCNAMICVFGA